MKRTLIMAILASTIVCISCLKEDHFGKSPHAFIQNLQFEGQLTPPTLDSATFTYSVVFAGGHDITKSVLSELQVSNFATSSVSKGGSIDLSSEGIIKVTAEDGSSRDYKVQGEVDQSGGNIQIPNSSFDTWREVSAPIGKYWEIGSDANSSSWATANEGVTILSGNDANTLRIQVAGSDYGAECKTTAAPALVRIAAGSLFTGKFYKDRIDVNDPEKAVEFGIPYQGRPAKFRVDYQYTPGASNEDASGTPLGYPDSCDIYVKLENRNSGVVRVGTAWFRSSEDITSWKTIEEDVIYGQVPPGSPAYMQIGPGETWGSGSEAITHISVVITASAGGNKFFGAVGSTLKVNNFELVF